MKIILVSLGKAHDKAMANAIDDFTKRVTKYFPVEWKIIPPVKNAASLSDKELKRKESESILSFLKDEDYLFLLDEKGKELSSIQLAQKIQERASASTRQIIFLIGGAFGVDEVIRKRAQFSWALSSLTFPHQLVRLILAEQIYRACTILQNEKYHHE